MKNIRINGLSKLIVALVAIMMVVPQALAYDIGISPLVTTHAATPNPYDPTSTVNYGMVRVDFYVNTDAIAETDILNSSDAVIRDGGSTYLPTAGTYNFKWDGKVGGSIVANGLYKYRIHVSNAYGQSTVTGPITVNSASTPACTAPVISNTYASPNPFNPALQSTGLYYTLNTAATVTTTVRNSSGVVMTTIGPVSRSAGSTVESWNGSGAAVGTYTYTVYATTTTCGNTTVTGSVSVSTSQSGTAPIISNDDANPNVFNPDDEEARISFTLNTTADVIVQVRDGNTLVETLAMDDSLSAGNHSYYWDGDDRYGDQVDDGDYTYSIQATNAYGSDTEYGDVTVDFDGSNDDDFDDDYGNLISNVTVTNALFNPDDSERAQLTFDVEEDNVDVTVEIIDEREYLQRTLVDTRTYDSSTSNDVYWNGRDGYNTVMDDDLYLFRITAEKSGEDDEVAYRYVEVDTDGDVIGFPEDANGNSCAGFVDVSEDNPYCKAIELMKIKGIFEGYPDGTFRLYSPINRAETVKVVLLAIDKYDLLSNDGTNVGFWDVTKNAWYITYLRTARANGIIRGYPDRSFRPNISPNKVELLKIFLEGTGINVPYCSTAPYNDTPADSWYNNYLCFAKNQGLVTGDSDGNYNPAQPMNRGDVAMLFYNFYVRGLDTNPSYYNYNSNYSSTYDPYNSYYYNY